MRIRVLTEVTAPDGATHYFGDLLDAPTWVKCVEIGVVGGHWFSLRGDQWVMLGHDKPHWAREIAPEDIIRE